MGMFECLSQNHIMLLDVVISYFVLKSIITIRCVSTSDTVTGVQRSI